MNLSKILVIGGSSSLGVGLVLLIVGLVLGFQVFPDQVQKQVAEKVLLNPGSESWDMWKKLPIPMDFKVYIFHVANPDNITKGMMPEVVERGPYVYKEYREKEDIVIHEEYGTASYKQRITFYFDPIASAPYSDSDEVTIFNLALMGMFEVAVGLGQPPILVNLLPQLFNNTKDMFLNVTVGDLLFGGVKLKCKGMGTLICSELMKHNPPPTLRKDGKDLYFSVFGFKNNSDDGLYEVKLGWSPLGPNPTVDGVKTVGTIARWNNSTMVSVWQADKCNKIVGTDAAIFPPFLTKDSRIDIFSTDLCRSLYAVFQKEGEYQGIPSLKFVAEAYMLADVTVNPDNNCFCPNENACLLAGALNLSACQGVPAVLTLPHFYMSDEKYLTMLNGLSPDASKHETFLELEPTTGLPLRGGKRIQFNILMREIEEIDNTKGVPVALMPFMWIDEGLNLDDHNIQRLKDELISILNALEAAKWSLIGIGCGLIVIGSIILLVQFVLKKKHHFD